mmetsp:Transcript_4405/g.6224  ORF Transcript_4405/g.6224 Transcript_4405/m.6224 type:complete len:390 (-) Transcript_4405:27-1196(-)|eukprot:CAMPEP_0171476100 /NCGR_PEP_ID=MMETSP0946-20130122/3395_1 /TAXON_ID=109269 /ORGANISM="Vaucheria litorea, Strain CCMP2940" /LENGTH=389 /DNA_ID=CAMNT_0012006309 /DNA_START=148 /DNA_END=1317 /DNA_ORIENTATION=+
MAGKTIKQNWQQKILLRETVAPPPFKKSYPPSSFSYQSSTFKSKKTLNKQKREIKYTERKLTLDSVHFKQILDDIQIRFIINLPPQELKSADRLFFQLEQAWWFYEDFIADENPKLPHFSLKTFARLLFDHCSLLSPMMDEYNVLFESFKSWKGKIPVAGCILLNHSKTHIVLVQNWKKSARSLPRGKINEAEPLKAAAIREVLEETGLDVSEMIDPRHCISVYQNGQQSTMFIVTDVPFDYHFSPRVRKEVSAIEWFPISSLPDNAYGIDPFIKRLIRWIKKERKMIRKYKAPYRGSSSSQRWEGGKNESNFREKSTPIPLSEIEKKLESKVVNDLIKETIEAVSLETRTNDSYSSNTTELLYGKENEIFGNFSFDVEDIMDAFKCTQ